MKKVLLALSLAVGFGATAQNITIEQAPKKLPLTPRQEAMFQKALADKAAQAQQAQKTSGGQVSQRMSHTDLAIDIYGGLYNQTSNPGGLIRQYVLPTFQDSTVMVDFGSLNNVYSHAGGQTFDVTQSNFQVSGEEPFTENDPYSVDTLYAGGFYSLATPTSGLTGDTLVFEVVYGMPSNTTDIWSPIIYPNGTFPGQTADIPLRPIKYEGNSAHGYVEGVNWIQKIVIKKALTANDTNEPYHKAWPTSPIQVPAGAIFGFSVTFKPGYSYNPGDVYFAGAGSSSTAVLNSFVFAHAGATSQSDDTPYFLEAISVSEPSWAISQSLSSKTRYNAWTGSDDFRNEFLSPMGTSALFFDIWVTGTSTFSVDEEKVNNNVALYPNPTTGNVSIAISQGGTYNLEVVNMLGQVVHAEEVTVSGNEELKRDLSHLTKGIYLVNIKGDNYSNTSKLTINK